jgi:hypothetical protein
LTPDFFGPGKSSPDANQLLADCWETGPTVTIKQGTHQPSPKNSVVALPDTPET